jgi:hypothetical protein
MTENKERKKAIQGLTIVSITIISSIIAAYTSILYFDPSQLKSILPATGMIIVQLFILRIARLPTNRGTKDDIFTILMTILTWFISLTIMIQ